MARACSIGLPHPRTIAVRLQQHPETRQQLANLVVQFAGHAPPFLLLDFEQAAGKVLQPRRGFGEAFWARTRSVTSSLTTTAPTIDSRGVVYGRRRILDRLFLAVERFNVDQLVQGGSPLGQPARSPNFRPQSAHLNRANMPYSVPNVRLPRR